MSQLRSTLFNLRFGWLPLVILGYLWFILINHLRVEWSVNPQYGYGWAVPFLCLLLIWRRAKEQAEDREWKMEDGRSEGFPSPISKPPSSISHLPAPVVYVLFAGLALAWLPTRVIQEANPEWRLVSWALAIEVIGLTLLLWKMEEGRWKRQGLPSPVSRLPSSIFPLAFFLIAVPWPTVIEGPLIQFLTHTNAAATVEVVGWLGLPALQRGNVIEVGTGLVGIDDACSGIRSFQATLMISLFLGGLYRLRFARRVLLVLGGCALAFVFNVTRTSALVWIASRHGVPAMSAWHDPTGVAILLADFVCLWFMALALRRKMEDGKVEVGHGPSSEVVSDVRSAGGELNVSRPEFHAAVIGEQGSPVASGRAVTAAAEVKTEGRHQTSEVRGRESGVRSQRSEIRAEPRTSNLEPRTSNGRSSRDGVGPWDDGPQHNGTNVSPSPGGEGQSVLRSPSSAVAQLRRVDSTATEDGGEGGRTNIEQPTTNNPPPAARSLPSSITRLRSFVYYLLLMWLGAVEAGTELWYRSHEAHLPKPVVWRVEFPRDNPSFSVQPFSEVTKQFLRYDEGINGMWSEGDTRLQVIFLRWNPGRIAPNLAKNHTPEVCLTAAGHKLLAQSELRLVPVHGLQMPFRSYVVQGEAGTIHVFYCLWEDRAGAQSFSTTSLTYANRLEPVLAGRRNSGQRSLEIAIWGLSDETEAEAALSHQLEKLVSVGD